MAAGVPTAAYATFGAGQEEEATAASSRRSKPRTS